MLKVLLAHNYYGSTAPSGENQVFETERQLLHRHGHPVETFTRHSDDIRAKGAWGALARARARDFNWEEKAAVVTDIYHHKLDLPTAGRKTN